MRTKQSIAKKLNVLTDKAWEAISKIGRLDVWFPIISTCKVVGDGAGAHRYMTLEGGGEITDVIEEINPTIKRLAYLRIKSPFPVTYYKGTVEIFDSFDSMAVIVWTTVAELVKGAISAGIDGMEKDLQPV